MNKWASAIGGIVAIAAAATAVAAAIEHHGRSPAPDPQARLLHVVQAQQRPGSGPYLSASEAEAQALSLAAAMGPGARVLSARMTTVATASRAVGSPAGNPGAGSAQRVWLVWLRGPWRILNCLKAGDCPVKPSAVFYIVIDAKTGVNPLMGWSPAYPGAPAH